MQPNLILTRPIAQSESFAAAVSKAWHGPLNIILSPLMRIEMVAAALPDTDAVVFTSAHGVAAAKALGLAAGIKAWCVGNKTAQIARDAGFDPITGPGDADDLTAQIIASGTSDRLVHLRGRHTRGDVSARLNAAGIKCEDVVGYDQAACPMSVAARDALAGPIPAIIPLFSPRSAKLLQAYGPFAAPVHAVVISQAVKDALGSHHGWTITVAASPDAASVLNATLNALSRIPQGPSIA